MVSLWYHFGIQLFMFSLLLLIIVISAAYHYSLEPLQNELLILRCFQGVLKCNTSLKWVATFPLSFFTSLL